MSSPAPGAPAAITDLFRDAAKMPGLVGLVWFDFDKGPGHEWRIDNDPAAINAFRRGADTNFEPDRPAEHGLAGLAMRASACRSSAGHAPAVWKRRPMRKPTAAAPSPIATIFKPFFRQSPTRVTDE